MEKYHSEMRLFDPRLGQRLYLDERERELFLNAAEELNSRKHKLFCHVLHWTGARISEALELTGNNIDCDKKTIILRTLKKRKRTAKGELKASVFRQVPVPPELISGFVYRYDLKKKKKLKDPSLSLPLWSNKSDPKKPMSRSTGWRIVKSTLELAGIEGPQATAKGLRHGLGVAMVMGGMDIYTLQRILGHERPETTAIYLQVKGQEAHQLQMQYWKNANKNWNED
ncbi:MAG: integrase/recombinase XerD [Desulforhopalus sp.]|jgi:integrase/recombinase XerD